MGAPEMVAYLLLVTTSHPSRIVHGMVPPVKNFAERYAASRKPTKLATRNPKTRYLRSRRGERSVNEFFESIIALGVGNGFSVQKKGRSPADARCKSALVISTYNILDFISINIIRKTRHIKTKCLGITRKLSSSFLE